jgi:hypothetical protein
MRGVHAVIEDEFGGGEMSNPIVVSSVDEESKVLLHLLVRAFGLSIRLGVVRNRERMSDAESLVESFHESGGELGTTVGNDLRGYAMESEDFAVVNVRYSFCVDLRSGG